MFEHWSGLCTAVVLGITWMAIAFAAITWRHDEGEPAPQLATTRRTTGAGRCAPAVLPSPSPYLMQTAYTFTFAGAESSRFSRPIPHVVSEMGPLATAMITALSAAKPPLSTFCPVSHAIWRA